MLTENYDTHVERSWTRASKNLQAILHGNRPFHWGMTGPDLLLNRQVYMMREGRMSLHNMIRGAHGLPNAY